MDFTGSWADDSRSAEPCVLWVIPVPFLIGLYVAASALVLLAYPGVSYYVAVALLRAPHAGLTG